jgi:hypothetical protein
MWAVAPKEKKSYCSALLCSARMREVELGFQQYQVNGNTMAYNEVPRITESSVESTRAEGYRTRMEHVLVSCELCFLCGPCRGVIKRTKKIFYV